MQTLPSYHIYQKNRQVRCKFCEFAQHKWETQYAECKISECNVKFKLIACSFAKTWEIFKKHDHSHTNEKIVLRGDPNMIQRLMGNVKTKFRKIENYGVYFVCEMLNNKIKSEIILNNCHAPSQSSQEISVQRVMRNP
jgi:hypothetical protein